MQHPSGIGRTSLRALGAFGLYLAAALILFRPWLMRFSTALIGDPENNMQDFWNVWHATHSSLSAFFHTAMLRFPDGASLLYHSFSYPHIAAVMALSHVLGTDRETLIWLNNAALFASFPIAGLGGFLLVRRFVPNTAAALLGGFVFAFNPSHVAQLFHHAHVTHIEFVPFFVLAYLNAVERKTLGWVAAAALAGALAAYSCWYYLFYAAYFVAFHTLYMVRVNKQPLAGWAIKAPLFTLGGMALLVAPLVVPMLLKSGGVEHPGGTDAFVADIEAFFAFPTTHVFAAWSDSFWTRAHTYTSNNFFEGAAYLGLVNIALLVWLWRHKDQTARYLFWVMGVFGVLAMGDCLHAFGFDTLVPLPGIIPNHLPFFSQVRTPGRAMVMVYLFLGVAIAYVWAHLATRWRGQGWAKAALAGLALLIVADFAPVHFVFTDAACSPGFALIATDKEPGFGVLNLPFHNEDDRSMLDQTCHGKPVVQAAVSRSFKPPLTDRLDLKDFAHQRAQFTAAGVKYLVIDRRIAWETERDPPRYALRRWVIRKFPSLGKMKGIAIPPYQEPIPQAAYEKAFPAIYRSDDIIILKVR